MADEVEEVDKNHGRVAVTGDGKGKCVCDRDRKIEEEMRGWRWEFCGGRTNYDFMSSSDNRVMTYLRYHLPPLLNLIASTWSM